MATNWTDPNYDGQGKSQAQETEDSGRMVGVVVLVALVVLLLALLAATASLPALLSAVIVYDERVQMWFAEAFDRAGKLHRRWFQHRETAEKWAASWEKRR